MRTYLLTIICLGSAHYELRAAANPFAAICDALGRYPQACSVSARALSSSQKQEAANV